MSLASMRGASTEALSALAAQVADLKKDSGQLGSELLGVAQLVRSEPSLRRTLTDPSLEAEAKAALFSGVLAGKVSASTQEIAAGAASRRWTSQKDLATGLEHLGVQAVARAAKGNLAAELFAVAGLINKNPELRSALTDPARTAAAKQDLLANLLAGKISAEAQTLVTQSLQTGGNPADALLSYQTVAAAVAGELRAVVRTVQPLTAADQTRLAAALTKQYERPVSLDLVIDPTVLGGLRVEIGDDVIDGSVSARLSEVNRQLAG